MLVPIFIISLLILGAIIYINFERLKPKWTKIGAIVGKLKWWQKGALVGLGLGAVVFFFTIMSGGYMGWILNLPVLPFFIFFVWLVGYFTKGASLLEYFGQAGPLIFIPLILIHLISWIFGGIVYAFIFHTIRRLTKHSQKNKRQI